MGLNNNILILILILTILLISSADSYRGRKRSNYSKNRRHKSSKNSTDFDVLIFTQHWPQTVCYTWKEKTPSHSCDLPVNDEWTIHGLWPTQYHKLGPAFCNPSLPFDASALAPIEKEMEIKWIDVENGTAPYSFWKHEWTKHGTCSAVLEPLSTEEKYFKKGLELLDEYDMKHVLAKANILPGQAYPVQTYLDAVYKVLGKRAQVECISNKKKKQSYIFEIRICFDKSLKLVDCDGIAGFPTNCSPKRDIIYPAAVPTTFHVVQI